MRGGNGRLSRRLLSLLGLFLGCLLDGLLRFLLLYHSHLLWFVRSPRRQTRRGRFTERTIVCRESNGRLITVTRKLGVAQSIAKRIRISSELSIVFVRDGVNLATKTPRYEDRTRARDAATEAELSAEDPFRDFEPGSGETTTPTDDAHVGREPEVNQVRLSRVNPDAEAVSEAVGRGFHGLKRNCFERQ